MSQIKDAPLQAERMFRDMLEWRHEFDVDGKAGNLMIPSYNDNPTPPLCKMSANTPGYYFGNTEHSGVGESDSYFVGVLDYGALQGS